MKKVQKKTKKSKPKKKMRTAMISFQPASDVQALIPRAMEATGATRSDLIQECIRKHLAAVVREISDLRSKKTQEFFDSPKSPKFPEEGRE